MPEDFKFEEEAPSSSRRFKKQDKPLFVRWLMKTGLVKNKKQAQWALLGILGVCILLTFFLLSAALGGEKVPAKYKYNPQNEEPDIEDLR